MASGGQGQDRLGSLQVLRAVAAMAVVVFHCNWTGIASFGVELFFVISGFIICYAATADPDQFLLKRAFRIIPLYWLATLVVFVLATIAPGLFGGTHPTLANLARSLFFIPYLREDGESFPLLYLGWTLNYEVFFYLAFALCLTVSRRFADFLAMTLLLVVVLIHPLVAPLGFAADFWTRPILLNFVCGIGVWLVWSRRRQWVGSLPVSVAVLVAGVILAELVVGMLPTGLGGLPWRGMLGAVLLLAMARLDGVVTWAPLALLVGDASYSLYLLHPYVLQAFNRFVRPLDATPIGIAATVLAITAAVIVAVVSFRLVERPSNRALRAALLARTAD